MDPRYKSPESNLLRAETDDFTDLHGITTLLVWLLRLGAVISVVAVWANWLQLELLGRQFTLQEAQANDLRERTAMISTLVVAFANYIVFCRWIYVAHRNLPALGLPYPEFTPGWAVGWFFIPVANLWKPYQAMRQLWQASVDTQTVGQQDAHPLLVAWWSMWIIVGFVSSFALSAGGGGPTLDQIRGTTLGALVVSALRIPQYVIAWLMVQKIWDAQVEQRRRQLAGTPAVDLRDAAIQG